MIRIYFDMGLKKHIYITSENIQNIVYILYIENKIHTAFVFKLEKYCILISIKKKLVCFF